MKFNAYGRKIEVVKTSNGWEVQYIGNEGKNRTADDILIPNHLEESEIRNYLEDLLHEWANSKNNEVIVIK